MLNTLYQLPKKQFRKLRGSQSDPVYFPSLPPRAGFPAQDERFVKYTSNGRPLRSFERRRGVFSRHDLRRLQKATSVRRKIEDMSKKLFVGSLSWETNDDRLQAAFAPYGEITEAKVITDRDTGRSRGFGFVTFAVSEDATKAISALDGKDLDGRAIKVNEAQDKPRDGGGRSEGGYGGERNKRW